uniref:Uncharacterized protein n=1 Tax=Anguilla anguilla TaxID=7936 RepID=A0A0E9XUV3_ANGAN
MHACFAPTHSEDDDVTKFSKDGASRSSGRPRESSAPAESADGSAE